MTQTDGQQDDETTGRRDHWAIRLKSGDPVVGGHMVLNLQLLAHHLFLLCARVSLLSADQAALIQFDQSIIH